MSNDLKEAAMNAVQKRTLNMESFPDSKPQQNKLYKDYYDLQTNEPINLESITRRVKKRLAEIDRSSVGSMLDLFFIYQNWTGFYSREDSFGRYLKDEVQISRTHAYGIIHSVELLNDYFVHRGNQTSDLGNFMNEITSSIEEIGISKLIVISAMKDDDQKFGFVDRLLEGENITVETLLKKPEKKQKAESKQTAVKVDGNDLMIGDTLVLTFNSENKAIRNAVFKVIEKWYRKDHQPKRGSNV